MKFIILLLLPFLAFSIKIFPDNSQDFTAYGIAVGGNVMGERFVNLFTDDIYLRFAGGLLGSVASSYLFRNHISTDSEWQWNSVGRGQAMVGQGIYLSLEWLFKDRHKKKAMATLERWKLENS